MEVRAGPLGGPGTQHSLVQLLPHVRRLQERQQDFGVLGVPDRGQEAVRHPYAALAAMPGGRVQLREPLQPSAGRFDSSRAEQPLRGHAAIWVVCSSDGLCWGWG